ncbi:hypothetical protein C8R42DRAFT_647458 [Lentinula raphanica]|nr:hypothetical protein C8R42DRAFT_647458 [Lentinula raphanica]
MILSRFTNTAMFFAAFGMAVLALPVPNDVISTLPSAIDVHVQAESPAATRREIFMSKRMDQNPQVTTHPSSSPTPPATLEPPVVAPAPPSGFPTKARIQALEPPVEPPAPPTSYQWNKGSASNTRVDSVQVPAGSTDNQHVTQPLAVVHPVSSSPKQAPQGQHSTANAKSQPSWIPAAIHGNPNPGKKTFEEWNQKYSDKVVNTRNNKLYKLKRKPDQSERFGLSQKMAFIERSDFYRNAKKPVQDHLQKLYTAVKGISRTIPDLKLFNAYFILATQNKRVNNRIFQIRQSAIYGDRFKREYEAIFGRIRSGMLDPLDMINIYLADGMNIGYESS